MSDNLKSDQAYKTIGEITKELGLIDDKTGNLQTHTLRYWEKQFNQLRPTVRAGKRRYYSKKDIKIIKQIKFLLKDKGLTIKGAKKVLKDTKDSEKLDDDINLGLYKLNLKNTKIVKDKIKKISKIVKELKRYK